MGVVTSSKDDLCIGCFDNVSQIGPDSGALISVYLKNNENTNLAVNGSVTPVVFSYYPPGGTELILTAIGTYLDEGGSFTGNGFASIGTPLANGLKILLNDNEMFNFQANKDFELWYTYQNPRVGSVAVPPTRMIGRCDLTQITNGLPIRIDYRGIKAVVRDNLAITNLDIHIMVQGYLRQIES